MGVPSGHIRLLPKLCNFWAFPMHTNPVPYLHVSQAVQGSAGSGGARRGPKPCSSARLKMVAEACQGVARTADLPH